MKKQCNIISDIIPLYLDNVCSEESKEFVEKHIKECNSCQTLLEHMKIELPNEPVSIPKEETVLKQTAWNISKQAINRSIGVTVIILYWLVYLWQETLSNIGDYRYFPYTFHECYTIGYLFVPAITFFWLTILMIQNIKKQCWRKNMALTIVLIVLFMGQIGYIYNESQLIHTTTWTDIAEIPDEYHIVIENEEHTITLSTTPLVTALLKTDGTIYRISYESNPKIPYKGQLNVIENIE